MKILNLYTSLFLITSFYSTVSCVWILIPQHDASCRTKYVNAVNLANAAEQGCYNLELIRNSQLGKYLLKKDLLLTKRYRGLDYQSEYPIYEMIVRFRSAYAPREPRRFKFGKKPEYKITFAWNKSGNICIPLGLIGYDEAGREYTCENQPSPPDGNAEFTREMIEPAVEEVINDYPPESPWVDSISPSYRSSFASSRGSRYEVSHESSFRTPDESFRTLTP